MLYERSTKPVPRDISPGEQKLAVEVAEGNGRNLQDGFRSPHLHDSREVLIQLGTILRFEAIPRAFGGIQKSKKLSEVLISFTGIPKLSPSVLG